MCCSACQVGQVLVEGTLHAFAIQELLVAIQGPGQHHFSSLLGRGLRDHGYLGIALALQLERMHVRSFRLDRTFESNDLQLRIPSLQQELCLCSCPPRVCRQYNASKGLQELGKCQEALMHALGVPLRSLDQVPRLRHVLEEDDSHLAPQGLPLVGPVFSPRQGLIVGDVKDRRGLAGQLVHESLLEHRLDVVPPSHSEGASRCSRCSKSIADLVQQAFKAA